MSEQVRDLVSDSWRRSHAARVDPDHGLPPHVFEHREVADVRAGHPLAEVLPLLRDTLLQIADEAMHMMIVTDAQGHILWREGHQDVLRRAEGVGLVEGTRWSEDAIGTNAMGTALAENRALRIHSSEHHVRAYHPWTCAAAPIHEPDSGEMVGVVDITGPARTFHPTTLALVSAAAKLAEKHLETRIAVRDERLLTRNLPHLIGLRDEPGALLSPRGRVLVAQPDGWLAERVDLGMDPADGMRVALGARGEGVLEQLTEGYLLRLHRPGARRRPSLALRFLGAERPVARLDGRAVRLSSRHAELLTLLALHPEGLTADRLTTALYGDAGKAVTVRAEMHRLRVQLDAGIVRTQPYRLQAAVDADFLALREALRLGRAREAADLHRGELLPASDAPAVREERDALAVAVRSLVLRSGDAEAVWSYARTEDGKSDEEVRERLGVLLPAGDPRRTLPGLDPH
ncbi:GAF domain-containing protein [Pseudonocardia sp. NPDC049154]|uniref:GAF domain-containing protein n=1 Tax=Pseudonocardia sp. NPDC049154 TaxID=3155501 RepID=UPI0033E3393B